MEELAKKETRKKPRWIGQAVMVVALIVTSVFCYIKVAELSDQESRLQHTLTQLREEEKALRQQVQQTQTDIQAEQDRIPALTEAVNQEQEQSRELLRVYDEWAKRVSEIEGYLDEADHGN